MRPQRSFQKIISVFCCFLGLITSVSPAQGSPVNIARQWRAQGSFRSHVISRNIGVTQWDSDWATRGPIPRPGYFFKGPTVAWLRSGLYKYARKTFRPLTRYMGIDLPSWFRSPDTFAETFHEVMGLRKRNGDRIVDEALLEIQTGKDSPLMTQLAKTAQETRDRLGAAGRQSGPTPTLGDLIVDLGGGFKTPEETIIPSRSLQDLLNILTYEVWKTLFESKNALAQDPLRHGPFATLMETVRQLNPRRADQAAVISDILHRLREYETALDSHLTKLYNRLVVSSQELQDLDRWAKSPDIDPSVRQTHEAKRAKLATEYLVILNDLALFIRLKQYDIRATEQYLYGLLRGNEAFRNLMRSQDIVPAIHASIRSPEALTEEAQPGYFVRDQQDHLPTFGRSDRWNYRLARWGEAIDRANTAIRSQGKKAALIHFAKRVPLGTWGMGKRLLGSLWQGWADRVGFGRFGFWKLDDPWRTLFPCLREGALLYYCRLSDTTHAEVNTLLKNFRDEIGRASPEQRKNHKFYADLRTKYINSARGNTALNHPDILQGLFSILTQMNPESRAGRQFRNLLHPGNEAKALQDTQLGQLRHQEATLQARQQAAQAKMDTTTDPNTLQDLQDQLRGIEVQLQEITSRIGHIENEWERVALDLSQNRILLFTSNGIPIYDFPAKGKIFSIGSPLLTFPIKGIRSVYRFGRSFVGGGWIANGLSDHAAFFARTRHMISTRVADIPIREEFLTHLTQAQHRMSTVLEASFQLGLTPAQSQQLINALFVPRDTQAFLNVVERFINPYRSFSENRKRLLAQLTQLEKNYNKRLSDLEATLANSIRGTTDTPTPERVREQAEVTIAEAHRLRQNISELEKALGIDTRSSADVVEGAPLQKKKDFDRALNTYQHQRALYLEISEEIHQLEDQLAKGTAPEDSAQKLAQLRRRQRETRTTLDQVQADLSRLLEDYKAFATRHQRMEVALSEVENAERELSQLLREQDTLQARIADYGRYGTEHENYDMLAALSEAQRRLAEVEPRIAPAQRALEEAKATFRTQYPEYNLEARLRRNTLTRDLPGRSGARWNQFTYEMLRSSDFERQALREGSEALALVERLNRYGTNTGDETWTRVVRQCIGSTSQGRAMLRAGGVRGVVNTWRFWTRDFYRQFLTENFYGQFRDPFSGVHNQARLDYLHDATLPSVPTDLLDTLELEERARPAPR